MSQGRRWLDDVLAGAGERPVSEREWKVMGPAAAALDPYSAGPSDLIELVAAVRALRANYEPARAKSATVTAVGPPEGSELNGDRWRRYQAAFVARLFGGYGDQQREVLGLLGLDWPMALRHEDDARAVARHLVEVAGACPKTGESLTIETPLGGQVKFYLGYHLPEDLGPDHLIEGQDLWTATACKPLARLREHARRIARETGCSEAEAVAYLVCNVPPALPLAGARAQAAQLAYDDDEFREEFDQELGLTVRHYLGPRVLATRHLDHTYYTITVFSHLVPPTEVAELYRAVRDRDAARSTYSGYPSGREAKPMRPWTLELVRFVSQERQTVVSSNSLLPWSQLRALWNRRYPQKPYKTWQSMRRAYLEATRPRKDSWPVPGQLAAIQPWQIEELRRRAQAGASLESLARELAVPLAYLRDALGDQIAEPHDI